MFIATNSVILGGLFEVRKTTGVLALLVKTVSPPLIFYVRNFVYGLPTAKSTRILTTHNISKTRSVLLYNILSRNF